MPSKIELLHHEPLTYEEALNKSFNIIQRHEQLHAKNGFTAELWRQRDSLAEIARHHLHLGNGDHVTVYPQDKWLTGGFNMCVPVDITSGTMTRKFLFKCPMPFKVAESNYPGSVDEKLRGEVGAYAWMQQHCPGIRIPRLYGFGSPSYQYTHLAALPWHRRLLLTCRRWLSNTLLRTPPQSRYFLHEVPTEMPFHYMLLEFIGPETGHILVNSWSNMADPLCRKRLFRGMASIILEMARVPQARIGSFRFNNNCTVTLANRAMFAATAILESQGSPRTIQEGQTYASTEPFVADMMNFYDENLLFDRCASNTVVDCRSLLATRSFLRAVAHHFIRKESRDGPFLPQLTDLNGGNFFVDDDWNITCLFDLEWVCALPAECLEVPYWLAGVGIGDLTGDKLTEFSSLRQEFLDVLREEEAKTNISWPLCSIMDNMWATNGVWFWHSLASVDGAFWMVLDHLSLHFCVRLTVEDDKVLSQLWNHDAEETVQSKLDEFSKYAEDVKQLFDEN